MQEQNCRFQRRRKIVYFVFVPFLFKKGMLRAIGSDADSNITRERKKSEGTKERTKCEAAKFKFKHAIQYILFFFRFSELVHFSSG